MDYFSYNNSDILLFCLYKNGNFYFEIEKSEEEKKKKKNCNVTIDRATGLRMEKGSVPGWT